MKDLAEKNFREATNKLKELSKKTGKQMSSVSIVKTESGYEVKELK
jgi:hypothetical protein